MEQKAGCGHMPTKRDMNRVRVRVRDRDRIKPSEPNDQVIKGKTQNQVGGHDEPNERTSFSVQSR
jgi:hypothetical protein